jgi:hypothetical protein
VTTDLDTLALKKQWIEEQERSFAWDLARNVIDIPGLSIWMVLIPIILVYHIFRHNHAVKGRSAFVEHYMLSRNRCLEEACQAMAEQRMPDVDGVTARAVDLPDAARPAYGEWIAVLIRHYADLIQAPGTDHPALVRGVYRTRSNFLIFLNQLNQLEKKLNSALNLHLAETMADAGETIQRIETATAELRRRLADAVFP